MDSDLKKYKLLSLFSGAGGFDLGFELSGRWRTVAAIDFHPMMVQTLRTNKNLDVGNGIRFLDQAEIIEADLSNLGVEQISGYEGVDLVLGGPPCQDFSMVGRQGGYEEKKGSLIASFQRVVSCVRPKAFLFENVPNMKSAKWLESFTKFCDLLSFSGDYVVQDFLLNCADYGAATIRERIFIVGFRTEGTVKLSCPQPTHMGSKQSSLFESLSKHVSVSDALSGLPPPTFNYCGDGHFAPIHDNNVVERFKLLRQGERDHIRRRNRLYDDLPAYTLFAGGEKGGTRTHIHPTEPRELTPRECARLHGFPDEFNFSGNKSQMAIQIANSVPVLVAKAWGKHLANMLDNLSRASSV